MLTSCLSAPLSPEALPEALPEAPGLARRLCGLVGCPLHSPEASEPATPAPDLQGPVVAEGCRIQLVLELELAASLVHLTGETL